MDRTWPPKSIQIGATDRTTEARLPDGQVVP